MRTFVALCAGAAVLVMAGGAAAQAGRVIDHPDWVEGGDPAKLRELFPAKASAAGLATGRAVLDCIARQDGRMTSCQVTSEDPPSMGFSDAALKLAAMMALAPKGQDGKSVEGAHVRFAVRINKPDDAAAAATIPDSRLIKDPVWRTTPNDADLYDYPTTAANEGVNGRSDLRCRVTGDGHLADCAVLMESPPELGFGTIALKVATKYQIAAKAKDGTATAGREVQFTIEFSPGSLGRDGGTVLRPTWAAAPSRRDIDAARTAAPSSSLPDRMVFQCDVAEAGSLNHCHSIGPGVPAETLVAAQALLDRFRLTMTSLKRLKSERLHVQPAIRWRAPVGTSDKDPIGEPMWVSGPTGAVVRAAFPAKASALGVRRGQVGLSCVADASGRMSECQVLAQSPSGDGFGEAALTLAREMTINPWTEDGRPVEGRQAEFSIPFDLDVPIRASPARAPR